MAINSFSRVEIKKLWENFLSLSVLNFINYGFPLILIPYLTRVLGVEKFGLYTFAFATLNYFTLIIRYGFEFSATKQVAILQQDKEKRDVVFSAVLIIRLILVLLAFIMLLLLINIIPKFKEENYLLLCGIGIFIGNGLIPIWFFQGMENMKFMTIINFIIRFTSTVLVFLFVKAPSDYHLAMLFQSIGFFVGAVVSLLIAFYSFKIRLSIPTFQELTYQVVDGWHLFLSTIGTNFYRESNTIILGFVTNYTVVGYYAAAEKIIKAIQAAVAPFVHVLFPVFGRKMNGVSESGKIWLSYRKIGLYYGVALILISIVLYILSPFAIGIYLGDDFIPSILDIRIMSPIILFGGLNYYYGVVGLVNLGKEKTFSRSVWIAGVCSVIVCYILVSYFGHIGAAIALLMAEVLLFIQILYHIKNT